MDGERRNVMYLIEYFKLRESWISTPVKVVFDGNRCQDRIVHVLERGGVLNLSTLLDRVITNSLRNLPRVGWKTEQLILFHLLKEGYIREEEIVDVEF